MINGNNLSVHLKVKTIRPYYLCIVPPTNKEEQLAPHK